jgi:hypothetical protein
MRPPLHISGGQSLASQSNRPAFVPRPDHARFVVDKMALGHAFRQVLWAFSVGIFPKIQRTQISFIYHRRCIILPADGIVK